MHPINSAQASSALTAPFGSAFCFFLIKGLEAASRGAVPAKTKQGINVKLEK